MNNAVSSIILTIFIICGLSQLVLAKDSDSGNSRVIYVGATVIDGTGAAPRHDMAIVVDGERIEAVVHISRLSDYDSNLVEIVDTKGWYALPGLIDSHTHVGLPGKFGAEARLRRYIYSGITSVRDLGGDGRILAYLARGALLNEFPSPDIFYSAFLAGPSFHKDRRVVLASLGATAGDVPWIQAIREDTDLSTAVAMGRGTGASGIKIYADLSGLSVRNITREGHRQNMQVWSHGMVFPAGPADVVDAGVDGISHVCLLSYHGTDTKPERYHDFLQPEYSGMTEHLETLFQEMARKRIILDPTLRAYKIREGQDLSDSPFPFICPTAYAIELTRAAYLAGVPIAAGTDGPTSPTDPFTALHEELELLAAEAGIPTIDVIRSATETGAILLGQSDEMGTITARKLANLLFVAEDPLADVANLRTVTLTVKRGVAYWRSDYESPSQSTP